MNKNQFSSIQKRVDTFGQKLYCSPTIRRGVEQLAARRAHNPEAAGSSPAPANPNPYNTRIYEMPERPPKQVGENTVGKTLILPTYKGFFLWNWTNFYRF